MLRFLCHLAAAVRRALLRIQHAANFHFVTDLYENLVVRGVNCSNSYDLNYIEIDVRLGMSVDANTVAVFLLLKNNGIEITTILTCQY